MEGDEPPHFLGIFAGHMVVRDGQAGDYNSVAAFLSMYHVRGFNVFNTRAIQCSPTPTLLDSDDAFVVHDTKTIFVWKGAHVSDFAFEVAQLVAKKLKSHVSVRMRLLFLGGVLLCATLKRCRAGEGYYGQRVVGAADVLEGVGRQEGSHAASRVAGGLPAGPHQTASVHLQQRLRHGCACGCVMCASLSDVMAGKAAVLYSHLRPHDQVVLDTWDRVYVWSGRFSPSKDSFFALQVAQTYLEQGKRKDVKVCVREKRRERETNEFAYVSVGHWCRL